jgi:hypothetical protein
MVCGVLGSARFAAGSAGRVEEAGGFGRAVPDKIPAHARRRIPFWKWSGLPPAPNLHSQSCLSVSSDPVMYQVEFLETFREIRVCRVAGTTKRLRQADCGWQNQGQAARNHSLKILASKEGYIGRAAPPQTSDMPVVLSLFAMMISLQLSS